MGERVGDKLKYFRREASVRFNDRLIESALKDRYADEVEELYVRGNALLKELDKSLPNLDAFNEQCNEIFAAPSNQQSDGEPEFLFDICAQGSAACIDKSFSEHVACCCGYNPATQLGGEQDYRIGGSRNFKRRQLSQSSAENSWDVGFRTERRELSDKSKDILKLPDVCAETYVQLMPLAACVREDWDGHPGFEGKFDEYQERLHEANADYCKFEPEDSCVPTTTTQAPKPPPEVPSTNQKKRKEQKKWKDNDRKKQKEGKSGKSG